MASSKRELGIVLSWNSAEGFGRIQADSGDVLWAHFSLIQGEGFRTLSKGERVEFEQVRQPGPPEERGACEFTNRIITQSNYPITQLSDYPIQVSP
jgi:CspA family cold shock protein